jgi:hypothetical protein
LQFSDYSRTFLLFLPTFKHLYAALCLWKSSIILLKGVGAVIDRPWHFANKMPLLQGNMPLFSSEIPIFACKYWAGDQ